MYAKAALSCSLNCSEFASGICAAAKCGRGKSWPLAGETGLPESKLAGDSLDASNLGLPYAGLSTLFPLALSAWPGSSHSHLLGLFSQRLQTGLCSSHLTFRIRHVKHP